MNQNLPALAENQEHESDAVLTYELFGNYEISASNKQERAVIATEIHNRITSKITEGIKSSLEAGYFLCVLKDSKCYMDLGDHIKTWSDYLSDKGISTGTDSNYRGIATIFGKTLAESPELQSVDYKRLTEILPFFRNQKELLTQYEERLGLSSALGLPEDEEEREEALKHYLLSDAVNLPKKGWQSQLQEIKGQTPADTCAHDKDFDVLHRCRGCGQLYSPEQGHSTLFVELEDLSEKELEQKYLEAVKEKHGDKAQAHTRAEYHNRKKKFFVQTFEKSPDGIYSTSMGWIEHDRKGFINLTIETLNA